MKKFEVKFKRVFKDFNNKSAGGPTRKIIEAFQTVEANTFKEARDIIRSEHENAMSINITEVPDSFRDNTPEETAAFDLKYTKKDSGVRISMVGGGMKKPTAAEIKMVIEGLDNGTMDIETGPGGDYLTVVPSTKLRDKTLSNNALVLKTVLHTIDSSPAIRKAVEELVRFRPKKIAMEDKIAEILTDADICDYTEDFLVRYQSGSVSVEQVTARKKPDTDSGRVEETGIFENQYGERIV